MLIEEQEKRLVIRLERILLGEKVYSCGSSSHCTHKPMLLFRSESTCAPHLLVSETQRQLNILYHPASDVITQFKYHRRTRCRQAGEGGQGQSGPKDHMMSTTSWMPGRLPLSSCSMTMVCHGGVEHTKGQAE